MVKAKSSTAAGARKRNSGSVLTQRKASTSTARNKKATTAAAASSSPARKPAPRIDPAPVASAPRIRIKLKRGRFTMPEADFDRIALLKHRSRELGRPVKKNELLRAGLRALVMLSDESLMLALSQLEAAKPAR